MSPISTCVSISNNYLLITIDEEDDDSDSEPSICGYKSNIDLYGLNIEYYHNKTIKIHNASDKIIHEFPYCNNDNNTLTIIWNNNIPQKKISISNMTIYFSSDSKIEMIQIDKSR